MCIVYSAIFVTAITLFLILKNKYADFCKSVDCIYSIDIVRIAHPQIRCSDLRDGCIYILQRGLFRRAFVQKATVEQDLLEIISTEENYVYKFKHIGEYIDSLRVILQEYGFNSPVQFSYNKNMNSIKLIISAYVSEIGGVTCLREKK